MTSFLHIALVLSLVTISAMDAATAQTPLTTAASTPLSTRSGRATAAGASRTPSPDPIRDPIASATREYQRTGVARTVQMGDVVAFPYGTMQPTVTCAALRTCVIELQPGETVYGIPPHGDAERWSIHTVGWGPGGTNPVVIVRPLACDITTNVVILTDRHLYDLTLDALPCRGPNQADTPTSQYMRRVTFYYPEEELAAWANAMPLGRAAPAPNVGVESLNYGYRWTKDKEFPWSPDVVFDDGAHLYIKIPRSAEHAVAPVLFVVDDHGRTSLLNYTVTNGFYITDRVVPHAVLVLGVGGTDRRVTIDRTRGAS